MSPDPVVGGMDGPSSQPGRSPAGSAPSATVTSTPWVQGGSAGVVKTTVPLETPASLCWLRMCWSGGAGELCVLADDVQSGGPL